MALNKNIDNILGIYKSIEPKIFERLEQFNSVWERQDEKELFQELAFCLLTPQSKARSAAASMEKIIENNLLFNGNSIELAPFLNNVRFGPTKAGYIQAARELFFSSDKLSIKTVILKFSTNFDRREWLVANIKGFGYKESSHFLRNIGFGNDIAILDRHILKNLLELEVINELPKTLTKKNYYDIEERMRKFAKQINIPFDHLDFVFWNKQTGDIFK